MNIFPSIICETRQFVLIGLSVIFKKNHISNNFERKFLKGIFLVKYVISLTRDIKDEDVPIELTERFLFFIQNILENIYKEFFL